MRQVISITVLICVVLALLAGCSDNSESDKVNAPVALPAEPAPQDITSETGPKTQEYSSFHYQLQGATYNALDNVNADVIVIDPDDAALTESELSALKQDKKLVLAYLSIGEAEDYRDYWKASWKPGSPEFIDSENPEWKGNYKVKYWDTEWQGIILDRAKEIATQGYDGAYLDIIDAYGYYEDEGRDTAAQEMIDFVNAIKNSARQTNPDFIVVPQNSPELYAYPEYKEIIAGFGKEDTWYDDNRVQDTEETEYVLGFLDQAIADGKFVLAIDYPTKDSSICDFYTTCASHRFACTVSDRELERKSPVLCQT
ncbi:endo alpha-1,4 polygalactosaminidase [Candidatus Woesearchaeota archaeon]|nr:endo alpha-1,4 polygalactosaminidase [Candidatus Woesearchaeota archaeon]